MKEIAEQVPVRVRTCLRGLAGFPIVFGSMTEVMVVEEDPESIGFYPSTFDGTSWVDVINIIRLEYTNGTN